MNQSYHEKWKKNGKHYIDIFDKNVAVGTVESNAYTQH